VSAGSAGGARATRFLLIRHGQSVWNREARWQGQGDPPLTERGRAEARSLAARLLRERPERLVASDLLRAAETAALLAAALGLEARLEPRLREWDVGAWSGLTLAEVERRFPDELARVRAGDPEVRPGGGESRRELQARALAALSGLAREEAGRCVAVVTHGGLIRTLLPDAQLANAEFVPFSLPAPL
jgi:probable phosphoglycerate mutase